MQIGDVVAHTDDQDEDSGQQGHCSRAANKQELCHLKQIRLTQVTARGHRRKCKPYIGPGLIYTYLMKEYLQMHVFDMKPDAFSLHEPRVSWLHSEVIKLLVKQQM